MLDKEKIINALERCINGCDNECPYEYDGAVTLTYCREDLMRDALELLKEQEPVKVADGRPRCRFECGNCGTEFAFVYNYCPSCGRKVKWDAVD